MADFAPPCSKTACHVTQSNHLLPAPGDGSLVDDHCYQAIVYAPLCKNVTSFNVKLKVHNVLHCRQTRTE